MGLNDHLTAAGEKITLATGTMVAAVVFALLSLVSLPAVPTTHGATMTALVLIAGMATGIIGYALGALLIFATPELITAIRRRRNRNQPKYMPEIWEPKLLEWLSRHNRDQ